MMTLYALITGFIIDYFVGDPHYSFHPICLIGRFIATLDRWLRTDGKDNNKAHRSFHKVAEILRGGLLCLIVLAISTGIPFLIIYGCSLVHPVLQFVVEAILCWQILAMRSLKVESMKVYTALKEQDVEKARYNLSMIVGRDTAVLDETGIIKAAVETVAENTSDGVIAPMIYLAIGGPVLGFAYKAVNTMDSMIAYKDDRYQYFGKIAARLDDIVNFLPARISALFLILGSCFGKFSTKNAIRIFFRDRYRHASPNSAQTESVCAGALCVQLAGNATYRGVVHEKPFIGDDIRPIEVEDIKRVNHLMYLASFLCLICSLAIRCLVVLL